MEQSFVFDLSFEFVFIHFWVSNKFQFVQLDSFLVRHITLLIGLIFKIIFEFLLNIYSYILHTNTLFDYKFGSISFGDLFSYAFFHFTQFLELIYIWIEFRFNIFLFNIMNERMHSVWCRLRLRLLLSIRKSIFQNVGGKQITTHNVLNIFHSVRLCLLIYPAIVCNGIIILNVIHPM